MYTVKANQKDTYCVRSIQTLKDQLVGNGADQGPVYMYWNINPSCVNFPGGFAPSAGVFLLSDVCIMFCNVGCQLWYQYTGISVPFS